MALPTYHCLECEKEFKAGNWECTAGQQHVVAAKTYYTADAPTVPEWRNGHPYVNKQIARTQILNIPPERKVQDGDEMRRIPGGSLEFIRGQYTTSDPEIQFYLDKKESLCSKERWEEVYLTDEEKIIIQQGKLANAQLRLQSERNELLEKVKAMEATPERKKPGPKPKNREGVAVEEVFG